MLDVRYQALKFLQNIYMNKYVKQIGLEHFFASNDSELRPQQNRHLRNLSLIFLASAF